MDSLGHQQMLRIVFFILCTLFLIRFSRRSLTNPKSHGFYRFFAFEAILILLILNQPYWFRDPFTPLHLLSWFFLFSSLYFIIHSLLMLKRKGGHGERKEMPENLSFENTVNIVATGPYRYVRHPMYSSLLLLGWGAYLKHITVPNTVLIILASGFLVAAAKVEERENIHFFGREYALYMLRTKMFLPWLL